MPLIISLTSFLAIMGTFLYLLNLLAIPVWISSPLFILMVVSWLIAVKPRWQTIKKEYFNFKPSWLKLGLAVVSILSMASFTIGQRYNDHQGLTLQISNAHDSLWHVAVIQAVKQGSPPAALIHSGSTLTGYHYTYDLLLGTISYFTKLDPMMLYVFIAPYVLAPLLALSCWGLFQALFKDKVIATLGTLLVTAGSGFAYLAPRFFPIKVVHQTLFWLDQPVAYAINHQLLFSLSVVTAIYYLIIKEQKKLWWLIGILLGSLAGIKVYGAVTLLLAIGCFSLYQWLANKQTYLIKAVLLAGLIVGGTMLFNQSELGNPFIWSPGWFIKTMYEGGDHLNYDIWELQRQTFAADHNLFRLTIHWLIGLVIFLVGNFGVKILGLATLAVAVCQKRSKKELTLIGLFTLTAVLSILIPMLFIQDGVVWNSMQFLHYAQIPLAILLVKLITMLFKGKTARTALTILLVMALPTTVMTVKENLIPQQYINFPATVISQIKRLQLPAEKEVFLSSNLANNSLIPAITGRAVFRADNTILSILGLDQQQTRQQLQLAVNEDLDACPSQTLFIKLVGEELVVTDCD